MAFPLYRMRGLFDNPQVSQDNGVGIRPTGFQFPNQPNPDNDMQNQLASAYDRTMNNPVGQNQQAYKDFLSSEPQRSDYQPNKAAKIAAILGGISTGIKNGPGAGVATADAIRNKGYDEAQNDWMNKGKRLKEASDVEEKDINNRVKSFRDEEEFIRNTAKDEATANYQAGLLGARNRANDIAAQTAASRGWTTQKDANSGHVYMVRPSGNGLFDKLDLGQIGQTPDQVVNQAGKRAEAVAKAQEPYKEQEINARGEQTRQNIAARFKNQKDLITFKQDYPDWKYKTDDKGNIIAFNPKDPYAEPVNTGVNSGKLSDTDKANLGLAIAKSKEDQRQSNREKLQNTPTTKESTSTVSGNTRTTTTTTRRDNTPSYDKNAVMALAKSKGLVPFEVNGKVVGMSEEDAKIARTKPDYKEIK
jgi:hypothetical protein